MVSIWIIIGLVVTTGYLSFLLYLSYWASESTEENVSDYFVADGNLSTAVIFLTGVGSALSSFTFLGSGGITYNLGVAGLVIVGAIAITDFPAIVIVGEKIWSISKISETEYVTPADLLCDRFDDSQTLRVIVAIIAVAASFFYIAIQFKGIGLVFDVLTGGLVSDNMGIAFVGIFMAVYIAMGGMRGVAYTDALQAVLLFLGMAVIALWVVFNVPGDIYTRAADQAAKVSTFTTDPINMYTAAAGFGLSIPVWPHMWERYFAARKKSGVWGLGLAEGIGDTFLLTLFAGLIGLAGIVSFPGLQGGQVDTVILRYVMEMPGAVLGVMMAAAIAAAMSSADSIILMIGSIASRDVYQVILSGDMSEKKLSFYSKISSGAIAFLALIVATQELGAIIQLLLDLTFPGYFLFLPVVVAAFWWPRANKYGAVAGLLAGMVTLVYLLATGQTPLNIWLGFTAGFIETIVLVAVTLLTPSPPRDHISKFINISEKSAQREQNKGVPTDD